VAPVGTPRLPAPPPPHSRAGPEPRAWGSREPRPWLLVEKDDLAKLDPPLPLVEYARDAELREGYVLLGPPSGG